MTEKVYLVTGSELASFSKEKINLALNWVISAAAENPDLSVTELASLLKENVSQAVGETEEWVYGVTGAETVAETVFTSPVAEFEIYPEEAVLEEEVELAFLEPSDEEEDLIVEEQIIIVDDYDYDADLDSTTEEVEVIEVAEYDDLVADVVTDEVDDVDYTDAYEVEDEPESFVEFTVEEELAVEDIVDVETPVADEEYELDEEELQEEPEEEVVEEQLELVEVLGIDVENAILNIINSSETNQVTVDDLRNGLGDNYSEEQFGSGFWNLVENNRIRFDDATGLIEVVRYDATSTHVEEPEPEVVEEELVVEETGEEETDFFNAPVVSRQKQYQGLFREAGQIDR